jgi:Cys-tRNA(Pro)/Cys-tRNA(Cys) deacylase
MLDAKKVNYAAHPLPDEKLSAQEVADFLHLPAGQIFKSIVAVRTGPGKPVLAVIPGDRELVLKLAAAVLGEKKLKVASHDQAESLTGLQTGGISPLALINKGFQILLDRAAEKYATILVSGGQRGLNLELAPADLVNLTGARLAVLTDPTD